MFGKLIIVSKVYNLTVELGKRNLRNNKIYNNVKIPLISFHFYLTLSHQIKFHLEFIFSMSLFVYFRSIVYLLSKKIDRVIVQ